MIFTIYSNQKPETVDYSFYDRFGDLYHVKGNIIFHDLGYNDNQEN